jgi:hypothetical protein
MKKPPESGLVVSSALHRELYLITLYLRVNGTAPEDYPCNQHQSTAYSLEPLPSP